MVIKITEGISVGVETFYQWAYSKPLQCEFTFAYRVTIENFSEYTVKLLRRHWYIFDSNGMLREVEGEGVVGQQPLLEPLKSYQYVSACHLQTEVGRMRGIYLMERVLDGKCFEVQIPEFYLIAPFKLN